MREDEDRSLFDRQSPEGAIEQISIVERERLVGSSRSVDRKDSNVGVPRSRAACLGIAGVDQEALQPGVETVRIAEARQLTPGDHQRLLYGVLGPSDVPQDPSGDPHQPVAARPDKDGECLPVPVLCLLDEVSIHEIGPPWRPSGTPSDCTESGRPVRVQSRDAHCRWEVGGVATEPRGQPSRVASTLSSTLPLSAWLIGHPSLAASAATTKSLEDIPGTTPRTVRALETTFQPASAL